MKARTERKTANMMDNREIQIETAQIRINALITHKRRLTEEIISLVEDSERVYYAKLADAFNDVIIAEAKYLTSL